MTGGRVIAGVALLCVVAAGYLLQQPISEADDAGAGSGALPVAHEMAPRVISSTDVPVPEPGPKGGAKAKAKPPAPAPVPVLQPRAASNPKPRWKKKLIPFGPRRRREMADYSQRHYGDHTWVLSSPQVIVEHYSVSSTLSSIYNIFAPDHADSELGELPNTCSHFAVGPTGKIWQFVPLNVRCRHTVGLNYTSIGIEHVGFSDQDILGRSRQLKASLRLTHYLQCRYGITNDNVIGHNESLSSPFHKELVSSLKNQTHGDWTHADMEIYRRKLAARGSC